jgi:hypothetical protein
MLLKYIHSYFKKLTKSWLHVSALKGHLQAIHVIDKEVHSTVRLSVSLLNGRNIIINLTLCFVLDLVAASLCLLVEPFAQLCVLRVDVLPEVAF